MNRFLIAAIFCTLLTALNPAARADECQNRTRVSGEYVRIEKKPTHFEVTMNFSDGVSHFDMGTEYGNAIHDALPEIEPLLDSYISEIITMMTGSGPATPEMAYAELMRRVEDIRPHIPFEYQEEIDGMSASFKASEDNLGDGSISRNELYLANLFPDVARGTACTAFSVFGGLSASRSTIAARNLDWIEGSQNQLDQMHAVTTINQGEKSVCLIGFVGFIGAISAINDNHVYAGILDSPTGAEYDSLNKRSYVLDLRQALEDGATLDEVADAMTDPAREYAFNHLVFLADPHVARVVENNVSDPGSNNHRAVRSWDSELNPGIEWGIENALGVVNSFVLLGNSDNHMGLASNYERWATLLREARAMGTRINRREVREIISCHQNELGSNLPVFGDLFFPSTLQSMIVEPEDLRLQIAFKPSNGIWDDPPKYEKVKIGFASKTIFCPAPCRHKISCDPRGPLRKCDGLEVFRAE